MPVTYQFQEKIDRRSASVDQQKVTYTRVYHLISSERVDEATATVYLFSPGPAPELVIGMDHPVNTAAKLRTVDLQDEAADGRQWEVTLKYETLTGGGSLSPDPLSRAPEVEWDQSSEEIPLFKDFSSTPLEFKNSAGFPFESVPTRERALATLSYTRNESVSHFAGTVLPLLVYDYVVNSATFTIDGISIPALYARLKIRASKQTEGAVTYYRVTYTFEFRPGQPGYSTDGWRERYLDLGYHEVPISGLKPVTIKDGEGKEISEPYPLDGAGHKKPSQTDPPAVLGPFKLYREVSFSPLSFT